MMTPQDEAPRPRRGLPRVKGGSAWPVIDSAEEPAAQTPVELSVVSESAAALDVAEEAQAPVDTSTPESAPTVQVSAGETLLRRGLPRTAGGDPWPPATVVVDRWARPVEAASRAALTEPEATAAPAAVPTPRTAESTTEASPRAPREPRRIAGVPLARVAAIVIGALALAVAGVLCAQWFRAQPFGVDFLATYPGATHLPEWAPEGLPVWLNWSHFLNAFFMVLIMKTGLQVRREARPGAFWSPKWNSNRKISLTIWLHQAIDVLWLANGVIFVVLLFATGQWVRVVPLEPGVILNAISAGIQYLSLDWPADENGWVNYNSLQVLAYFVTIFIAAPLAAASGTRMSGIWPSKNERLNRLFPLEWARAIHFPVMLYFVGFILVHGALVLSTGALRNLNHMYAGQDATHWWGLVIFLVSVVVMVLGAIAARPVVVAPIAKLFGSVTSR